jgi:hypothetical protein
LAARLPSEKQPGFFRSITIGPANDRSWREAAACLILNERPLTALPASKAVRQPSTKVPRIDRLEVIRNKRFF